MFPQTLPVRPGLLYLGCVPYANLSNVVVGKLIDANPTIWRRKKQGSAKEFRTKAADLIQARARALGITEEESTKAHAEAQEGFTPSDPMYIGLLG